jgi:hypothetical protein
MKFLFYEGSLHQKYVSHTNSRIFNSLKGEDSLNDVPKFNLYLTENIKSNNFQVP